MDTLMVLLFDQTFLITLAVGVLASQGANSLLFGGNRDVLSGLGQFAAQAKGLAAVGGYSLAVTGALVILIEKTLGFRVAKDVEEQGLDLTMHGEQAYNH